MNDELLWQDDPVRKDLMREILETVKIVPLDKNRIFLLSEDHDQIRRFFGTDDYPKNNFFRLDPNEIELLENIVFGKSKNQVNFLECWTRTGKSGKYVVCDGGSGGGGSSTRSSRDGSKNTSKKSDGVKGSSNSISKPTLSLTRRLGRQPPNPTPKRKERHINPRPSGSNGPRITFNNDVQGKSSTDLALSYSTAETVENTVKNTGFDINVNSSSGGSHSANSRHYQKKAVDINRVDGKRVDNPTNLDNVKALQEEFNRQPNIRANYGPALNTKTDERGVRVNRPDQAWSHRDHIHITLQ